jgi:fatty-acyl-CoA synthase
LGIGHYCLSKQPSTPYVDVVQSTLVVYVCKGALMTVILTGSAFVSGSPITCMQDVRDLESKPLHETLTVRSTYEIFRNSAAAFGEKTALTFLLSANPDDEPIRWSFIKLLKGIHQTANALYGLGVKPSDAVGVLLPACLPYHLALWGGEAAGVVQPLNPLLTIEKLASLLNATQAKVLIAWGKEEEAQYWSKAMQLRQLVPSLHTVLRVLPESESDSLLPELSGLPRLPDECQDFQSLINRQADDRLISQRVIQPTDKAAYFHTGGTTGSPKLAIHSHGSQVFTAWVSVQLQSAKSTDVIINGYPLFHVAGVLPGSLAALSAGVETVIPTYSLMRNKSIVANYWRLVEKYRSTTLSGVPTVLAALSNVPVDGADISSIRYCRTGAAALPAELAVRFQKLFGLHVHESFGMTETSGIATITPPGVKGPAGCVGFRVPYSQLRIVKLDEQGNSTNVEVTPGMQGMVMFKAPNVFPGFLNADDTAKALVGDGWLATGDLGWIDPEGRLHLSGRSKDLIIRGGHNIDPKMIEDVLGAHPAIQVCAAVGMPDAYAGELPVVFATLVPGMSASEQELLAFVVEGVDEPPARPKFVKIIEVMPTTNVGKIYKPELREMAAAIARAI